jgi:hypothetical protein
MTDLERIRDATQKLTGSWRERITYHVVIGGHREERTENRLQDPLIDQLSALVSEVVTVAGSGPGPTKVEPPLPGNFDAHDLLLELRRDLQKYVKRARLLLGYDVPMKEIAGTVCGECGGTLIVADDASSDVICVGSLDTESCGRRYDHTEWIALLGSSSE